MQLCNFDTYESDQIHMNNQQQKYFTSILLQIKTLLDSILNK